MSDEDEFAGLREWLREKYGPETELLECDKGTAGFSNETWLLKARTSIDGQPQELPMVLRRGREEIKFFPSYDLDLQYRILQALEPTPVPAPKPLFIEHDPRYLGGPFYMMERIAPGRGVVPVDGPPSGIHGMGLFHDATPTQRTTLWKAALDALGEIHNVDPVKTKLPFDSQRSLRDVVETQLDVIKGWYHYGSPGKSLPAIDRAIDTLSSGIPDQGDIVLCWGDPKPGNIVFLDNKVEGVLDWEMAYLGTPEMDVMYWIITDEVSASTFDVPRLPGCLGREETIRHYEAVSGRTLRNLDYHEMFQTLRLAVLLVLAERVVIQMGIAEYFPENWSTNNEPYRRLESIT